MFEGFSSETIDFLWGIRFNNRKDWFEEHKAEYQRVLQAPMKALAEEVFEPFADKPDLVLKVSRIYRDARYAHGVPYKDRLWFCIRRPGDGWCEHPALFFELTPEEYHCGFGLISPRVDVMTAYRAALDERGGEFLAIAAQIERDTGLQITGSAYRKRRPCENAALAPYYNLKNLFAYWVRPVDEALFSPALADEARRTLLALLPLNEFCQKFVS